MKIKGEDIVEKVSKQVRDEANKQMMQAHPNAYFKLSSDGTNDGFNFSVLSEFRARLIEGSKEKQILDKMLSRFGELGLLKSRGKARTDSTHILAAVKELTRLEHLEETRKYALNTLAAFAPTWLEKVLTPEFYERYGQKVEHSKKTRTAAEKEAKAIAIGTDGFYLLDAIYGETTLASIRNLRGVEVLRQGSQKEYGIDLFGPVALNAKWQAKEGAGFDLSNFRVNWKRKAVYCPQGKRSRLWKNSHDAYGKPTIHIEFRKSHCSACPVRSQCTRAPINPRGLTLMIQEEYEALVNARQRQKTAEFKKEYSLRSGIEGTISQGIRGFNLRQCRYVGLAKTRLQHILTAAAINLERIYAWLEGVPLAKTRISHFENMANPKLAIAP